MNYKIFRVEFNNGTNEYIIPTGWVVNQTLFCTDTHAVFVLSQIEQPRINDYHANGNGLTDYAIAPPGGGYTTAASTRF